LAYVRKSSRIFVEELRKARKSSFMIADHQAEFRTLGLPNTKHECYNSVPRYGLSVYQFSTTSKGNMQGGRHFQVTAILRVKLSGYSELVGFRTLSIVRYLRN
jgi:hypothetical protein